MVVTNSSCECSTAQESVGERDATGGDMYHADLDARREWTATYRLSRLASPAEREARCNSSRKCLSSSGPVRVLTTRALQSTLAPVYVREPKRFAVETRVQCAECADHDCAWSVSSRHCARDQQTRNKHMVGDEQRSPLQRAVCKAAPLEG